MRLARHAATPLRLPADPCTRRPTRFMAISKIGDLQLLVLIPAPFAFVIKTAPAEH
jgi:hypothetical protein